MFYTLTSYTHSYLMMSFYFGHKNESMENECLLTLIMLNMDVLYFENNVDSDQMASDEAIWSELTECSI